MQAKILLICFFCFFSTNIFAAISIVYNLRIAETTKHILFEQIFKKPILSTITIFDQLRKKNNGTRQNIAGGLGTFNYTHEPFYARIDFAAAHVRETLDDITFSRVQTDDILFSSGYSHAFGKRIKLTFSGLFGIPTHRDTSVDHIQFGYAHLALGVQTDGSFRYSENNNLSIRPAVRIIHFFPKRVTFIVNNAPERFNFNIGNLVDLFIAHHVKFGKNRFECGYNPQFFFAAKIKPDLEIAIQKSNYIRSSFYSSFKHYFTIKELNNAVTAALSYSFDHTGSPSGHKRIVTIWGSWTINY
jgi:hypothetical protein